VPRLSVYFALAFGESGIKTIDDLAGCATDDLVGWTEIKTPAALRHAGILDDFGVSQKDCETMIMYARVKAGWIDSA